MNTISTMVLGSIYEWMVVKLTNWGELISISLNETLPIIQWSGWCSTNPLLPKFGVDLFWQRFLQFVKLRLECVVSVAYFVQKKNIVWVELVRNVMFKVARWKPQLRFYVTWCFANIQKLFSCFLLMLFMSLCVAKIRALKQANLDGKIYMTICFHSSDIFMNVYIYMHQKT